MPQASFDDLYSAAYAILDDAKTDHDLVKLYKGSRGSPDPHPVVTVWAPTEAAPADTTTRRGRSPPLTSATPDSTRLPARY